MTSSQTKGNEFSFQWRYDDRLKREQLGKNKYANLGSALAELVTNSFDAKAKTVTVRLEKNALDTVTSIEISDDGNGISLKTLGERFSIVGIANQGSDLQFGKFGVGRFAVYRIGSLSEWTTTAKDDDGKLQSIQFRMDGESNSPLNGKIIDNDSSGKTGTTIKIFNLAPGEADSFDDDKIADVLITQFISYLLGHNDRTIFVQDKAIKPDELKESEESEEIEVDIAEGRKVKVSVTHLLLKKRAKNTRFPAQLLFCTKGKYVTGQESEVACPLNYIALVNSDYFEEILNSNRESLVTMDAGFKKILIALNESVERYQSRRSTANASSFLEKARSEPYYPYSAGSSDATKMAEQAIYDVVLEKVHESADLNKCSKRIRETIFRLVNRALKNSDLLDVLEEVAKLTDEDVERFKRVLARTTLQQILRLSDEVTDRLLFLDMLHDVIYGEHAKRVKERKQLHKMLEQRAWIFGDKFHLSTSDQKFAKIIQKHRKEVGLEELNEDSLKGITDFDKIPDLFLSATRSYPIEPQHHHLLVELKAPRVDIGTKEIAQIKKYGNIISKSKEFSTDSVHWDLFLISADVSDDVDSDRKQKDRPLGLITHSDNMKIWVFKWSEVIQKSKEEMRLVKEHLKLKAQELSVADYIKEEFPYIEPLREAAAQ